MPVRSQSISWLKSLLDPSDRARKPPVERLSHPVLVFGEMQRIRYNVAR